MKLLKAGPSPFVRKVLVVLHETEMLDQVEQVTVAANPMDTDPTLAAANPLGKIPALVREEGPTLYDSRVICRYLNDRAKAGLYPESRIWETLTLEATADGIMEAAVGMIYEKRFRPEAQQSPEWVAGQWSKVVRALDALNARWISHLQGRLDAGQIAVACALGYLDFRHPDRDWRAGRTALSDWEAGFAKRPSITGTMPEG